MVTARELRASVFYEKKKNYICEKKILNNNWNFQLDFKKDKKISSLEGTVW